jgi:hypothetical protein
MNIFKFSALCLFGAAVAFAQHTPEAIHPAAPVPHPEAPVPPPVSSDSTAPLVVAPSSSSEIAVFLPPVSSSSSVAAEIPQGKTIFDSVRGHAYNPYSTVGAASTVKDLVEKPSDINGQKFFYVSPTDRLGYAAFPISEGHSALLGLDNSPIGNPAALVLGYANSLFGLALNYSVSKTWQSDSDAERYLRFTMPGDNMALYLSIPLSFATIYANANWLTYAQSVKSKIEDNETTQDFSEIKGNIGLTGSTGSLNYDGYLSVIRTGGTVILPDGAKVIDSTGTNTYLGSAISFNIGYVALQNSNARVIVGSNNSFSLRFYDKIDVTRSDHLIGFAISPNILGEVSLFDNWLAFAGATHAINLVAGDNDKISSTSLLEIASRDETGAFAGIRYQKPNWAVEAQVATSLLNNPFGGFNGNEMFARFGGFINF